MFTLCIPTLNRFDDFLSKYLPKYLENKLINEIIITDENGITILEKFYENPTKYGFSFQIMAYISRLNIMKEEQKKILMLFL